MQNTNQKGGNLSGGAATAEALMSSRSILHTNRAGNTRGLQQYYTPASAAQLIKDVCNPLGKLRAFDPTAGDGSLLFPHPQRFGAEIDRDQIRAARYVQIDNTHPLYEAAKQNVRDQMKADLDKGIEPDMKRLNGPFHINQGYSSLQGDIQYLYPLIRLAGVKFSCIVSNPPFGLTFEHVKSLNDGQPASSTRIVWLMCMELLMRGGQGAFITGTKRLDDEILSDPNALKAIYYVLDFGPGELFEGVELPCSIAFFGDPNERRMTRHGDPWGGTPEQFETPRYIRFDATLTQDLKSLSARIRDARDSKFGAYNLLSRDSTDGYDGEHGLTKSHFTDIQQEYYRRLEHREKQRGQYDLEIRGNKIHAQLSALALTAIDNDRTATAAGTARFLSDLNGQRVNYFALNTRDWKRIQELAGRDLITVAPGLIDAVQEMVNESARLACPVYPIEPQQRLGYLDDIDQIKCIKDDPERNFKAGNSYKLSVDTQILTNSEVRTERNPKTNELEQNQYTRNRKVLKIEITAPRNDTDYERRHTFSETTEDIEYLLEHFDLPDPGDVSTRFPELIDYYKEAIASTMEAHAMPGIRLKGYQVDDIARLLFKSGGLLAWEQGLGKTLGSMLFALACEHIGETDGNALFITPQDLIPQWRREAKKFFGRDFIVIKDKKQARAIADGIKNKTLKPAWYITYFEAIAVNGVQVRNTTTLNRVYQQRWITSTKTVQSKRGRAIPIRIINQLDTKLGFSRINLGEQTDRERVSFLHRVPGTVGKDGSIQPARVVKHIVSTTAEYCPRCYAGEQSGWNGVKCEVCGETRTVALVKPMARELTTAFKQGCIVVDEGTKIKGDDSLTSLAVRGLRARRKLLMTGTPIKNYVNDCFHLLGWALGWGSTRFPFAYGSEGKTKFEKDFCVIEIKNRRYRKVLPEVTNLSILWKLLSGSIVRRRKEDTGEDLVERTFVPITAPMGTAQREQYNHWLTGFEEWYLETHPGADPDMVEQMAAALGQLHKLEFSSTMPLADEDAGYWEVEGLSNMTPANLKVLETAVMHVQQGEKVLIGSDVKVAGKWFADQLRAKGINAIHILDKNEETLSPAKRAHLVQDFIHGDAQVLCASEQSMNLGHNLDCASVVILNGLPWDFATLDQFLARVHRLTSQKPVTVYVVIPEGSLSGRKWKLLEDKGASSDLALDGHLIEKKQKPISQQQFLDELKKKGLPVAETVDEAETQKAWDAIRFELPASSDNKSTQSEPSPQQVTAALQLLLPIDDGRQVKPRIPRYTTMNLFADDLALTA